jgi:ubiquinone/menaquinone biosynthesis C-methylase UbiE
MLKDVAEAAEQLSGEGLAPGVPADYYRRIYDAEEQHWWYRGMRSITEALLARQIEVPGQSLLDLGCGTGGFLAWAGRTGSFDRLAGIDISSAAISYARDRVGEAELYVGKLEQLPFDDGSFDLIAMNDVLQHIPEDEIERILTEARRVLRPTGAFFVRTNGARALRRERSDWRAYSAQALVATLESGGFRCERITYANIATSLWALANRDAPRAPSEERHGIPSDGGARWKSVIGLHLLRLEAAYLRRPGRRLPYGHTLFMLARPAEA